MYWKRNLEIGLSKFEIGLRQFLVGNILGKVVRQTSVHGRIKLSRDFLLGSCFILWPITKNNKCLKIVLDSMSW